MSNINLELYKVFCAVARHQSLSRAAEELFVSQSAVSQSVKQLETRLGGRLFRRTARGVVLTAEGEALFGYADSACKLIDNAEQKISDMRNLKEGVVRIGASDTMCSLFLLDVLRRFHEDFPDIVLQVQNRTTQESLELLRRGEVDFAFVNLPVDEDAGLDIREIRQIHDCFVVGPRYAHLKRQTLRLEEIARQPLLMLERASNTRRQNDAFFASQGVRVQPAIELGSMELLLDFAEIGLGVAMVIEQAASARLQAGTLSKLRCAEPMPVRGIGLAMLQGVHLSFAATQFVSYL